MGHKVSKKQFKGLFPVINVWKLNDPWGMANIIPRGMVGRIYEGRLLILLNINYLNCGPD